MTRALWKAALNLQHEACPQEGAMKLEIGALTGTAAGRLKEEHTESQDDSRE